MANVIIGLGGLLSNPSCCVLKHGQLRAAVEQAKVSRPDRRGEFPDEAFRAALEVAQTDWAQIDCVAVARPFTYGSESEAQLRLRSRFLPRCEIVVVEHHQAHAASAFYLSGFEQARVLSVDRAGDYRSAVLFAGHDDQLSPLRELYYPDSLGDIYNRVTELLGFKPRADEHKVQWLSSFGEPQFRGEFWRLLHADPQSSWPKIARESLDADYLLEGGFSRRFVNSLGLERGASLARVTQETVAASLQVAMNETVASMLGAAPAVCLAGGLAFNALLIESLEARYERVFVQPVAGNAGTALGAALYARHQFYGERTRVPFSTLCLGLSYKPEEIKRALENCKLRFSYLPTERDVLREGIRILQENRILAWMQGAMEFGPRALGNRSILASPLDPFSAENLNTYIKHREGFRKFAASVPAEDAERFFEVGRNARFLASVGRVRQEYRRTFEAAVLGDDKVRVHTVEADENPLFHALLKEAGRVTGLPVLYNTSFNLFGDPLVCTPRDAVRSFYSAGIDALITGNFLLEK